jgi:hypothetical protein
VKTEQAVKTDAIEQFIELHAQLVNEVTEPVDESEVLRYLGYPIGHRPGIAIETLIGQWIEEASRRAGPRAAYVVLPVLEKGRSRLKVGSASGETEFRGAIGQFLAASQLIVAFIATAGPKVERLASQLMSSGEELPAMIVNAVGAERAEAAESAVIDRVCDQTRAIGLAATLPYSPGYCGMALTEQKRLFALFAGESAGVTLSPHCLMHPIKSVSGLIGLGPKAEVKTEGSPCERCELHSCNMRR